MNKALAYLNQVWAAVKGITFRGASSFFGSSWGRLSLFDTDAGKADGNTIIMSVVLWFARVFPEAPIKVARKSPDGPKDIQNHPMIELIEFPNPFYSGELLWRATAADRMLTGNAYWLKVKSDAERPVQLWWIPSWMIDPKWDDNGEQFITHYEYRVNGKKIDYPVDEIVHFRYGFDANNMRKGFSPASLLIREIFTDDEAAHFTAAILNNLGMPGVIISPGDPNILISSEDTEIAKQKFEERFTGNNRGRAMFLGRKAQVDKLSFSPEELNVRNLRRIPEERVTAVYGIPAVVVGLGAGLDRSTFANMAEAREAAYESNIIPEYRSFAADLRHQLLVDFEGDRARQMVVYFDVSGVRVLQEDLNKLFQRMDLGFQGGWIKRSEARSAVGLTFDVEDEFYKDDLESEEEPEDTETSANPLDMLAGLEGAGLESLTNGRKGHNLPAKVS